MVNGIEAVYILSAEGDSDYHFGHVVGVYSDKNKAEKALLEYSNKADRKACKDEPNCDFYYNYTIHKQELK